MTRGILGRALLCAGLLAVWALPAHAQAIGSIFGKVTDSSGAVMPGVTVTVTGTGLQTPLTARRRRAAHTVPQRADRHVP